MSTSEPNSTDKPMIDSTRPSQIGALDTPGRRRTSSVAAVVARPAVVAARRPVVGRRAAAAGRAAALGHGEVEGQPGVVFAVGVRHGRRHDAVTGRSG